MFFFFFLNVTVQSNVQNFGVVPLFQAINKQLFFKQTMKDATLFWNTRQSHARVPTVRDLNQRRAKSFYLFPSFACRVIVLLLLENAVYPENVYVVLSGFITS